LPPAQGKDLRDRECVRVANKGLRNGCFCAFAYDAVRPDGMPPRVFLPKSAELLENTGFDFSGERKERARVCKRMEGKRITRIGTGFERRRRAGQRV
jgi:hypothetical protein